MICNNEETGLFGFIKPIIEMSTAQTDNNLPLLYEFE